MMLLLTGQRKTTNLLNGLACCELKSLDHEKIEQAIRDITICTLSFLSHSI